MIKVVCIKNNHYPSDVILRNITVGKIYNVDNYSHDYYKFADDNNHLEILHKTLFLQLEKYREILINKILEE